MEWSEFPNNCIFYARHTHPHPPTGYDYELFIMPLVRLLLRVRYRFCSSHLCRSKNKELCYKNDSPSLELDGVLLVFLLTELGDEYLSGESSNNAIALLILPHVIEGGSRRYKAFLHFVFCSLSSFRVNDWYIVPIFHTPCGGVTWRQGNIISLYGVESSTCPADAGFAGVCPRRGNASFRNCSNVFSIYLSNVTLSIFPEIMQIIRALLT